MVSTYQRLLSISGDRRGGFFFLIDPDKTSLDDISATIRAVQAGGCDAILVGGSLLFSDHFETFISRVKDETDLPVIIFPGNSRQISAKADAILFLSFISSRNPHFLIGEQVLAAPIIHQKKLETISTGYMHIESGNMTSVEFFSGSSPIPRDKEDIAVAHALAAEFIGMKMIYLEAGSGARYSPPDAMIRAVSEKVSLPLIVGGGIRTPEEARGKIEAGASFVVIGNVLEETLSESGVRRFASAIHGD